MVVAVVRDRSQAEEVVQEVFVEMWRTAARYRRDRGTVLTWALTMAHHRAVDRVRSNQSCRAREHRAVFEASRSRPYDEVAESVLESWECEDVRRCLADLTALQRESLVLAYFYALTYQEVAALLKVTHAAVKTRIRDGLVRLRKCLTQSG